MDTASGLDWGEREPLSGMDLKLARVRNHVRQKELAAVWDGGRQAAGGCKPSTINHIEGQLRPTERAISKYLDALQAVLDGGAR